MGDEGAEQCNRMEGERSGEEVPSTRPGKSNAVEKRLWRTLLPIWASLGDSDGPFFVGISSVWFARRDRGGVHEKAPGGKVNSISFDLQVGYRLHWSAALFSLQTTPRQRGWETLDFIILRCREGKWFHDALVYLKCIKREQNISPSFLCWWGLELVTLKVMRIV